MKPASPQFGSNEGAHKEESPGEKQNKNENESMEKNYIKCDDIPRG